MMLFHAAGVMCTGQVQRKMVMMMIAAVAQEVVEVARGQSYPALT